MINPYPVAAPIRTADQAAILDGIDQDVRDIALSLGAREMHYSALIARDVLQRAEYPQAFPHLLMSASRARCPEGDATEQVITDWCLSPAVCYHAYAHLAGHVIDAPVVLTARGTCFRCEKTTAPGVRQIEFAMREVVFIGPAGWVDAAADAARCRVEALARTCGLAGEWCAAEDPFFLPIALGKAVMQRLTKVKLEYQSIDHDGLALASVNRHGPFFGQRFHITGATGEPVHTACVAIGLDRWCLHARRPAVAAQGVESC